ncbi:hypothetical protein PCL_08363 [Purpureocillium lilacinum]|uniref:Basic proline-rich protein n=1 Tax=Purpureocillium lilacinum TaxID=33203 RepID=A0A2U3DRY9_PURLI|nr:hypothetical protein PCL_08363 [Purpureocillium lilacinum]
MLIHVFLGIAAVSAVGGVLQSTPSLVSTAITTSSRFLTSRDLISSALIESSRAPDADVISPVPVSTSWTTAAVSGPSAGDAAVSSTSGSGQETGEAASMSDGHIPTASKIVKEVHDSSDAQPETTTRSSQPLPNNRQWSTQSTSHEPSAHTDVKTVSGSPHISTDTTHPTESPTEQRGPASSARSSALTYPAGSSSGPLTTAEVLTRTSVGTDVVTASRSHPPTSVPSNGSSDTGDVSKPISGGPTETTDNKSRSGSSAHDIAHATSTQSSSGGLYQSGTTMAPGLTTPQQKSSTGTTYQEITTRAATTTHLTPGRSDFATAVSTFSTTGTVSRHSENSNVLQTETRTILASTKSPVDKVSSRKMSSPPVVSAKMSTLEGQTTVRWTSSSYLTNKASIQDSDTRPLTPTAAAATEVATADPATFSVIHTQSEVLSTRSDQNSPQGAFSSVVPDISSWTKPEFTTTAQNARGDSTHNVWTSRRYNDGSLREPPTHSNGQPTILHDEKYPITDGGLSSRLSAVIEPETPPKTSNASHNFKYAKENESAARRPTTGSSNKPEGATHEPLITNSPHSPAQQGVLTATPTASSAPATGGRKPQLKTDGIYTLTSIVQDTRSMIRSDNLNMGSGTRGSLPTALPTAIHPNGSSQEPPSGTTVVYIGFLFPLNYEFVSANSMAASGITGFLPQALAEAIDMLPTEIPVNSLVPYDTRQRWGYITTLAKVFYPSGHVEKLQMDLWTPNSEIYNNQEALVRNLTALINPRIDIRGGLKSEGLATIGPVPTSSAGAENSEPDSNDTGEQASKQRATKIGIATGAIGGSVMCGAILFLLVIRYRRRKRADLHGAANAGLRGGQRASMVYNQVGPVERVHSGGDQRYDYKWEGASGRHTCKISGPVGQSNSLGW